MKPSTIWNRNQDTEALYLNGIAFKQTGGFWK